MQIIINFLFSNTKNTDYNIKLILNLFIIKNMLEYF